jgi:hypothetical protein
MNELLRVGIKPGGIVLIEGKGTDASFLRLITYGVTKYFKEKLSVADR